MYVLLGLAGFTGYIYIYMLYLSSVCLYPIKVKTAEPSGQNYLWDLAWPLERFMDERISKNLLLTKFEFWKFWKSPIFFYKIWFFFGFTMYTKRTCSNIKIEDAREAPEKPVNFLYYSTDSTYRLIFYKYGFSWEIRSSLPPLPRPALFLLIKTF